MWGTVYITVSADGLNLREQPNMNSAVLTTLSKDSEYLEVKEDSDFIEIRSMNPKADMSIKLYCRG